MYYDSASDMFLDNRRGLEDDIKHLSEEDKERVLGAFDWAVKEALTILKANNNYVEEVTKRCDKELVKEIEEATNMRFMELGEMVNEYHKDVESGKRVGYSAKREQETEGEE